MGQCGLYFMVQWMDTISDRIVIARQCHLYFMVQRFNPISLNNTVINLMSLLGHCDIYFTVHFYCHFFGNNLEVCIILRRTIYSDTAADLLFY